MAANTNLPTMLEIGQKNKETTINDNFSKSVPKFLGEFASDPATADLFPGVTYFNTTLLTTKQLSTAKVWHTVGAGRRIVLQATTTDTNPVRMMTPDNTNPAFTSNAAYGGTLVITANLTSAANTKMGAYFYNVVIAPSHGSTNIVATQVGTNQLIGTPSVNITFNQDLANDSIDIRVTNNDGGTMRFTALFDLIECV